MALRRSKFSLVDKGGGAEKSGVWAEFGCVEFALFAMRRKDIVVELFSNHFYILFAERLDYTTPKDHFVKREKGNDVRNSSADSARSSMYRLGYIFIMSISRSNHRRIKSRIV